MKGIKAFYKNDKGELCTGNNGGSKKTVFKVGGEYRVDGKPVLCSNGFHFIEKKIFVLA